MLMKIITKFENERIMLYPSLKSRWGTREWGQIGEMGPVHFTWIIADSEHWEGEIWKPLGEGQLTLDMA